jgi:hypothetical protein
MALELQNFTAGWISGSVLPEGFVFQSCRQTSLQARP